MNLWNPKTPVSELPHLTRQLVRHLCHDGYRTAGKIDSCSREQYRHLGYSNTAVDRIREAIRQQRGFADDIAAVLDAEGITAKKLPDLQPFDLLQLPLTTAQLGYLLRWLHDVAGLYGEKDIFCVVEGQVYYCTKCPYRDERSNFCAKNSALAGIRRWAAAGITSGTTQRGCVFRMATSMPTHIRSHGRKLLPVSEI